MEEELSTVEDYINAIVKELDAKNSVAFYKYIYEFIVCAKKFWK